jgi:hypothetical protein
MIRTTQAAAMAAILALTLISSAHACGVCAFSMVEPGLPAAVPWSIIGVVAYILVPVFIRPDPDVPFAWVFSPGYVFMIVVALSIFGMVAVGPFAFFAMLGLACVRSLLALISARTKKSVGFAVVLAVAIIGSGVYSSWRASKWDTVDRIARWPSSPPSRGAMNVFRTTGDITSLRRVAQADAEWESIFAGQYLAQNGTPETDGPLLINLLRRTEMDGDYEYGDSIVKESLEKLLPDVHPATSTADAWQAAFDARMAAASPSAPAPESAPE